MIRFTRIDAGTGEETPCDEARALRIIADHYSQPDVVIKDALEQMSVIRCTFAYYRVEQVQP